MEGERVPELEKVIKRLENLRDSIATDCIHDTYQAIGTINDALELLKEQANTINTQRGIIALQKQQIENALIELQVLARNET